MGRGDQKNFRVFSCNYVKILEKIALRARQDDQLLHRYRGFAICDEKSEDPAKMTHSISDFLRRHEPKNLPMAGQEG